MDIRYQIFDPSGNITALVEGDRFTPEERIRINDAIMAKHADVEQVGFLSTGTPEMTMAGGEFCGNATRSSILAYLLQLREPESDGYCCGPSGATMQIRTCGQVFEGGAEELPEEKAGTTTVWCRIPMQKESPDGTPAPTYSVRRTDPLTTQVEMEGISFLIKEPPVLAALEEDGADLKEAAHRLLAESGLDNDALGVIFLRGDDATPAGAEGTGYRSIVPAIWVKAVDTTFLENACGSGSIATTLAAYTAAPDDAASYTIMQPSGKPLTVSVERENGTVSAVNFSGPVACDGVTYTMTI